MGATTLRAFLDCDFYSLDLRTLKNSHLRDSLTTRSYFRCQNRRPGLVGVVRCLPLMFTGCRRAAVTSAKTIRFRMTQAARQLREDPKVKVSQGVAYNYR